MSSLSRTYAVTVICDMASKLQLETKLPFADPDMQMQWRKSVATNVYVIFPHNPRVGECDQMLLKIATSYITTYGAFAETYIGGANVPVSIAEELYPYDFARRFNTPDELKAHLQELRDMWLAYDPATPLQTITRNQSIPNKSEIDNLKSELFNLQWKFDSLKSERDCYKAKCDELQTGCPPGTGTTVIEEVCAATSVAPSTAAASTVLVSVATLCRGVDGRGCSTKSTYGEGYVCCMRCQKTHRKQLARKQ